MSLQDDLRVSLQDCTLKELQDMKVRSDAIMQRGGRKAGANGVFFYLTRLVEEGVGSTDAHPLFRRVLKEVIADKKS